MSIVPFRGNAARNIFRFSPQFRSRIVGALGNSRRFARAARIARGRGFSRTATRQRRGTSGIGVTNHYDARQVYRKKRMPRGRRRRWKKFSRKVSFVAQKSWGTQQLVFNNSAVFSNTTAGNQLTGDFGLYGLRSSASAFNDLKAIGDAFNAAIGTGGTGLIVDPSTKIYFHSGILDVTIRNTSTFQTGGVQSPAGEARLELDIYEISMRHTAEETGNTYNTLRDIFDTNESQTLAIGGALSEISRVKRGCCPFDYSYALSRFGVKIWKKTKYTLSNNDQMTYQIRDPKTHVTENRELVNQDGFNKPGWTKIVYFVGKLAPGLTIGSTDGTYQERVTVGLTRKYTCKVSNYSEDRTLYTVA